LRELISNASDAVDRVRFESLTKADVLEGDDDWKIKIIPDEKAKTLILRDNGIGMDKDAIVSNLGTIARSGTKAFLDQLKQQNTQGGPEFIGQFGVGFYSAFMVADKVVVESRMPGDKGRGVRWESTGDGTYTLEEITREKRGTDIILHMKEDAAEYLNEYTLRNLVKKFSDYIEHPIVMDVEKEKKKIEEETLNTRKAIWLRPKNEITEADYSEFYQHVGRDFQAPLKTIHFTAEGKSEYTALLYLPPKASFNLFDADHKIGVSLYVKRVFIMDDCKKLLPEYLRFIKGVVDSSDLPLNVSREILQENREMDRIKKSLVNKVLSTLKEMKEKEFDKYRAFYLELGRVLKEGVHFDQDNREKVLDLLLFQSTQTDADVPVTLQQYVDRMREGQAEIYYLTGESESELRLSPYLEKFKSKGYEVIFFTDPVDEWLIPDIPEYKGKKLKAIHKGDVDIDEKFEKKEKEEKSKEYKDLLSALGAVLPEVKEVRLSSRLTESACCLVADEHAMSAQMAQIFKAMNQAMPEQKPVLELNPSHALVKNLQGLYNKDPAGFARRLNALLIGESQGLV
jgi:molecular chaperone HtpG